MSLRPQPRRLGDLPTGLFTYGTLQFSQVMAIVSGGHHASRRVILNDYVCRRMSGRVYPGIIEALGAQTSGVLYEPIDPVAFVRLDRFEGDLYIRRHVDVIDAEERTYHAWTYVLADSHRHLLSQEPWDAVRFEAHHLNPFLDACRAFAAGLAPSAPGAHLP